MFEILTGCRCFNGGDNTAQVRSNILNKKMEQWPPDVIISSNAMNFFNKLLEPEPLKRFSCQQALRHDWLYELWQNRDKIINNSSNQYISPRLTPLQNAVGSPPPPQPMNDVAAMQAIVIRTSQSMNNLQSVFKRQVQARPQSKSITKKLQRKYKDLSDETNKKHKHKQKCKKDGNTNKGKNVINEDEDDEDGEEDTVLWKLRITKKKSRSLEQNELRATLQKETFQRLSLPTHEKQTQHRNRKYRAATLSNHYSVPPNTPQTVTFKPHNKPKPKPKLKPKPHIQAKIPMMINKNNNNNNNKNDMNDMNMNVSQSPSISDNSTNSPSNSNPHSVEDSPDDSPIYRLKHQKSLSSPSMNISISKSLSKINMKHSVINGGRGYHPSPVHEDYEHNEQQILKNQQFYDSSTSTNGNSGVQSSVRTNSKSSNGGTLVINGQQSSISYTGQGSFIYHHQKIIQVHSV